MIGAIVRVSLLVPVIFLAACSPRPSVYHEQLAVFGTLVEIKLWGVEEEQARSLVTRLAEDFEVMHHAWHPWQPGTLGRTN